MCACMSVLLLTSAVPVVAVELRDCASNTQTARRRDKARGRSRGMQTRASVQLTLASDINAGEADDQPVAAAVHSHTPSLWPPAAAAAQLSVASYQLPDIVSSCRRSAGAVAAGGVLKTTGGALTNVARAVANSNNRRRVALPVEAPPQPSPPPQSRGQEAALQARLAGAELRRCADHWQFDVRQSDAPSVAAAVATRIRKPACGVGCRSAGGGVMVCASLVVVTVSLYGMWSYVQR